MTITCLSVLYVIITTTSALPQFFSIGIGFGNDETPITFHSSDQSQQPQLSPFESQQSSFQPQQQSVQQQESHFQPLQPSFQPKQSSFQPQRVQVQDQQSFLSGRVTAAPPPARSAPAPPQSREQVRHNLPQQRTSPSPTRNNAPQTTTKQQQSQVESHQEALERNALHRKQLAEVIKTHNEKVFGQFGNEITGSAEELLEESPEVAQTVVPSSVRTVSIPRKRPVAMTKSVGKPAKPAPTTRIQSSLKKQLPDSIRDELLAHLDLINKLDKQVNELVRKASRVFSEKEVRALSIRKLQQEERRNKTKDKEGEEEVFESRTE